MRLQASARLLYFNPKTNLENMLEVLTFCSLLLWSLDGASTRAVEGGRTKGKIRDVQEKCLFLCIYEAIRR